MLRPPRPLVATTLLILLLGPSSSDASFRWSWEDKDEGCKTTHAKNSGDYGCPQGHLPQLVAAIDAHLATAGSAADAPQKVAAFRRARDRAEDVLSGVAYKWNSRRPPSLPAVASLEQRLGDRHKRNLSLSLLESRARKLAQQPQSPAAKILRSLRKRVVDWGAWMAVKEEVAERTKTCRTTKGYYTCSLSSEAMQYVEIYWCSCHQVGKDIASWLNQLGYGNGLGWADAVDQFLQTGKWRPRYGRSRLPERQRLLPFGGMGNEVEDRRAAWIAAAGALRNELKTILDGPIETARRDLSQLGDPQEVEALLVRTTPLRRAVDRVWHDLQHDRNRRDLSARLRGAKYRVEQALAAVTPIAHEAALTKKFLKNSVANLESNVAALDAIMARAATLGQVTHADRQLRPLNEIHRLLQKVSANQARAGDLKAIDPQLFVEVREAADELESLLLASLPYDQLPPQLQAKTSPEAMAQAAEADAAFRKRFVDDVARIEGWLRDLRGRQRSLAVAIEGEGDVGAADAKALREADAALRDIYYQGPPAHRGDRSFSRFRSGVTYRPRASSEFWKDAKAILTAWSQEVRVAQEAFAAIVVRWEGKPGARLPRAPETSIEAEARRAESWRVADASLAAWQAQLGAARGVTPLARILPQRLAPLEATLDELEALATPPTTALAPILERLRPTGAPSFAAEVEALASWADTLAKAPAQSPPGADATTWRQVVEAFAALARAPRDQDAPAFGETVKVAVEVATRDLTRSAKQLDEDRKLLDTRMGELERHMQTLATLYLGTAAEREERRRRTALERRLRELETTLEGSGSPSSATLRDLAFDTANQLTRLRHDLTRSIQGLLDDMGRTSSAARPKGVELYQRQEAARSALNDLTRDGIPRSLGAAELRRRLARLGEVGAELQDLDATSRALRREYEMSLQKPPPPPSTAVDPLPDSGVLDTSVAAPEPFLLRGRFRVNGPYIVAGCRPGGRRIRAVAEEAARRVADGSGATAPEWAALQRDAAAALTSLLSQLELWTNPGTATWKSTADQKIQRLAEEPAADLEARQAALQAEIPPAPKPEDATATARTDAAAGLAALANGPQGTASEQRALLGNAYGFLEAYRRDIYTRLQALLDRMPRDNPLRDRGVKLYQRQEASRVALYRAAGTNLSTPVPDAELPKRLADLRAAGAALEPLDADVEALIAALDAPSTPAEVPSGGGAGKVDTTGAGGPTDEEDPTGIGGDVKFSQQTRWEAAKQVVTELARSYVGNDLGTFRNQLAASVVPDASIFTNAFSNDYQVESEIQLDIILLNYRMNMNELCAESTWNRNAVRRSDGRVRIDTGSMTLCFGREEKMKLTRATGRLPFGISDPELQKQAAAGEPNPDPVQATAGIGLPVGVQALSLQLDNNAGGKGNVAFVDLETGNIRKHETANVENLQGQPGEDLCIFIDIAPTISVMGIGVHNGARVFPCDVPGQQLSQLRRVDPTRLITDADDSIGPTFAVQTSEGNFAFLEIPAGVQSGTYVISRDTVVQPSGTADCP